MFKLFIISFHLLFISSIILLNNCFAQSTWELLHPPGPTTNQLVSLHFIDQSNGWAVGEYGTILKTTDAGYNWRLIEIPQSNYLTDVFFPTALVGYAVGKDGLIIKSIDGGESWFPQTIRFTNNLHRVRFRDENNGWVIGEKGLIIHTNDGGVNWEQQVSNSREHLYGIALVPDTNTIIVVGNDSTLLATNNEGQSWAHRSFKPLKTGTWYYSFKDIFFLNKSVGWIGGSILLSSGRGGENWFQIENYNSSYEGFLDGSGIDITGIQQIYFTDRIYGFCLTDEYSTNPNIPYYTNTNGHNWNSHIAGIFETFSGRGRLAYLSDNRIICTGYRGEFRISEDKGILWGFPNQNSRNFTELHIANRGHLLTRQVVAEQTYVWTRSDNYGKTWQPFTPQFYDKNGNSKIGVTYNILGHFFNNGKTNRILCDRYYDVDTCSVYESNDYGTNWYLVHNQASKIFWSCVFLTADTLIQYHLLNKEITPGKTKTELEFRYSFDCGRIPHIENFQNLWSQSSESSPFISKHYFFNGHTGFLIGSEGNIIKTADTGQSWENIRSGVVEDLWDITFVNRQTGFVVGNFGRILKTTDGGQTWRKTDSGTQEDVYSIGFSNESEGWAGTETGLRHTLDGGETWQGVPLRYFHGPVREIEFDKDGTGYAYTHKLYPNEDVNSRPGGYFLLLVLKEGGVVIENTPTTSPCQFALSQNYPNPFNSTTHIRFSLPENASVSLKIYNIQGQLVRTLLDEVRQPGEHSVVWDGTTNAGLSVASGVYFLRLIQGEQVRVRKAVVLN